MVNRLKTKRSIENKILIYKAQQIEVQFNEVLHPFLEENNCRRLERYWSADLKEE